MTDSEDETLPLPKPAPGDAASGVTPAQAEALLAAGVALFATRPGSASGPGAWQPPTVEALQRELPQYEVSQFLARGGMGAVYKGVQPSLKRLVAIKVLPREICLDNDPHQFAVRFKQEAQAMAQLSHPNIVTVFEAGETPRGLLYFVMEFVEGTDVAQLIAREGRLDAARAAAIITAVCDALAFAHEEGIIHRDIKPSNVMIDRRGRVKVADFGLAKAAHLESALITRSDVAMGTPDFIAPEVMVPGVRLDGRADIYAVGVMFYQMLTGHVPRGRFSLPGSLLPHPDHRFDAVVDKALQTDRERRYSTAGEMRTALAAAAASALPAPLPAPAAPGLARPGRAPGRPALVVGLLAGTALLGAGAFWVLKQPGTPPQAGGGARAAGAGAFSQQQWRQLFPNENEEGWKRNTLYQDGLLHVKSSGGLRRQMPATADGSVRAVAHIRSLEDNPTLFARFGQGYYQALWDVKAGRVGISHYGTAAGGEYTHLGSKPLPQGMTMGVGDVLRLELRVIGNRIIGLTNGQPVVEYRDGQTTTPGDWGIKSTNGAWFESAEVEPYAPGAAPSTAPPAHARADSVWKSRWHQSGRLRAAGMGRSQANSRSFDLKAAEPYDDFVQVVAVEPAHYSGRSWAALRAGGDLVWSDGLVERGRVGLKATPTGVISILEGGWVSMPFISVPAEPVADVAAAMLNGLPGKVWVLAYVDAGGTWRITSNAYDAGPLERPDITSGRKVVQIAVGSAGTGVLREDGTLRLWNQREMRLPDSLAQGVRAVEAMGNEWAVLKEDGSILVFAMARATNGGTQLLPEPSGVRSFTPDPRLSASALDTSGHALLARLTDGRWTTGAEGPVEAALRTLHAAGNESFSVIRGKEAEGILWIEPAQ